MTQQELDALKALADAATPGPWEVMEDNTRIYAANQRLGKCYDQYDGKWPENAEADAAKQQQASPHPRGLACFISPSLSPVIRGTHPAALASTPAPAPRTPKGTKTS